MRQFDDAAQLRAAVGEELGAGDWHAITQADVDAFARLTKDEFFLHVDPERAKNTAFGGAIAHGLYTLSLEPMFRYQLVAFDGWDVMVNYGFNRVRFPAPVPVGSRIRMRSTLAGVKEVSGGWEVTLQQTFEAESADKPVCVAEGVLRLFD